MIHSARCDFGGTTLRPPALLAGLLDGRLPPFIETTGVFPGTGVGGGAVVCAGPGVCAGPASGCETAAGSTTKMFWQRLQRTLRPTASSGTEELVAHLGQVAVNAIGTAPEET